MCVCSTAVHFISDLSFYAWFEMGFFSFSAPGCCVHAVSTSVAPITPVSQLHRLHTYIAHFTPAACYTSVRHVPCALRHAFAIDTRTQIVNMYASPRTHLGTMMSAEGTITCSHSMLRARPVGKQTSLRLLCILKIRASTSNVSSRASTSHIAAFRTG
jgi:hypothetical protein